MSEPFARLRRFLRELKRRKVYRVAVGYLVAGFVVLQLASLAADAFGFPGWFEPMVWVVAGLGVLPHCAGAGVGVRDDARGGASHGRGEGDSR